MSRVYKGFDEVSSEVNPLFEGGRYFGVIKKIEVKDWKGNAEGTQVDIQFQVEAAADMEMPVWATDGTQLIFQRIYFPGEDEGRDKFLKWSLSRIKNLYKACGIDKEVSEIDLDELPMDIEGKDVGAIVTKKLGGVRDDKKSGGKRYDKPSNEIDEYFLPQ